MIIKPVTITNAYLGSMTCGDDLLKTITQICRDKNITAGRLEAIGAVQKAKVGIYDQLNKKYHFIEFNKPLEIVSITGNISLKDGEPFVHAHIALADENGHTFGGHLAEDTIVFVCEYAIEQFAGDVFNREFDKQRGLHLWCEHN